MRPLPFPLPLNLGTDIVHLPRITRLITRPGDYLTRFTRRILCEQEQHGFRARFGAILPTHAHQQEQQQQRFQSSSPLSSRSPIITPDMTRWLAGRFAAKEAARKAAPGGAAAVGWKDVLVRIEADSNSPAGDGGTVSRRPEVVYLGGAGEEAVEGRVGRLSISHDGEYVVATVLAAG
ncbi:hypothetical protein NUU61_005516 [Penicillium alfredii]|uniref:4'-phosphopantetheinyl transferase domain-containing protein n=1 Tax=Penicillium alfredii TaxID=1506179 RepID=A0A9W9F9U5_9EURO|nr:uncharacterized protein NUU61_005516 [Penicillium alfredii]KAJ5096160.1 hypothetical protein NUU61_005516 [Penicillium alfredii]